MGFLDSALSDALNLKHSILSIGAEFIVEWERFQGVSGPQLAL